MYIRTYSLNKSYNLQQNNETSDYFDFIFKKLLAKDNLSISDIVIFDIETTGFSAKTTFCYLIGCIYYIDGEFKLIQWFADNKNDEEEIIRAFLEFLTNYKAVLHYNGNGFDIPYLIQKTQIYGLNNCFAGLSSIDLYKLSVPYKNFFKLENLKQKTLEKFLDINRDDKYTGGELISVYHNYLKAQTDEDKRLLLLHNKDDLIGLFSLLPILSYHALFNGMFNINSFDVKPYLDINGNNEFDFFIELKTSLHLPKRISYGSRDFYFLASNDTGKLKIKVFTGELKFFYENYKDYYYLPYEDNAIHKSIASYVDKDYRTKARPSNCYMKKSGHFLPQLDYIVSPFYKEEYSDKITYFELTDEFLADHQLVKRYVLHILNMLTQKSK